MTRLRYILFWAMLKALGFGPYFIHSVETLFVDASASLSITCGKSEAVNVFRSC